MAEATHSSNDTSIEQGRGSLAELRKMFELRRQLAEAEIKTDLATTKRFAIVGGIGLVAVLTGLPLLLSIVTARVEEALELSFPWISVTVASTLLGVGMIVGWTAWRRFRFEFLGFRDSRQEIQEDLIWLGERFDGKG